MYTNSHVVLYHRVIKHFHSYQQTYKKYVQLARVLACSLFLYFVLCSTTTSKQEHKKLS